MVENGKQTTSDSLPRSPRNCEQQDPRSPNQRGSSDPDEVYAAQLETVLESIIDEAVIICDVDGHPVRMNRRARELFECDSVERTWQSVSELADIFELHTPEGSPITLEDRPLSRAIRGERFQNVEVRGRDKRTGSTWVFRCSGAPIRDSQGNLVLAVLTLQRVEGTLEVLRQRDAGLTSVLRAAPMGVGLALNRVLLDVNDWLCEMVGYRREELIGRNARMLYPTREDWEYVGRENYGQIDERSKGVLETRWRRKDGQVIDILLSSTLLDPEDPSRGVTFTALDITERKQAEETLRRQQHQLRESERKLRTLMGNLPGLAYRCANTPDWPFEFVSEGSLALTGYEPSEITQGGIVTYGDLIHPDDQRMVWDLVQDAVSRDAPFELEYRIRTKDGSEKWVFERGRAVPSNHGGPPFLEGFITDITQRKHAEMALRRSEERYRKAQAVGHVGNWEYDIETAQFWGSDEAKRIYGFDPDADTFRVEEVEACIPERQRVHQALVDLIERGRKYNLEFEIVTKNTRTRKTILSIADLDRDDVGRPIRITGAVQDITDRRRITQALEEKEHLLSESQRMAHIGSWSLDLATGVLKWTRETYRLYGVSPETFTPSPETFPNLLHPNDRKRNQDWVRAALTGERPGAMEFRVVHPDGSLRILIGRGELVFADDGRPIRLVGTVRDITEEKEAELALRELSRKDEEALRVARMGHWEFDVAGGMFVFNDQYYAMHGVTAQEAGGYRMTAEEFAHRYVHPDDAHVVAESILAAMGTNDPGYQFQTEARILRSDGQVRWVTVWFRAEKDAEGRTVKLHGVNQDITERRDAEEALRRLNEHLETLVAQRTEDLTHTVSRLQQLTWELSQTEDRERKRIADILHDDVQQILAAARFHLNLLSTGTRSPEESREILQQVKQMLKEAIEKARSLSHELSPALYQVDLADTLNWLARHMHEKHGLTVQVVAYGPVESSSECVKALLYKVTQELLFNVVKHAGVQEASIRVRRLGRYICLTVIDRGRGFKPQELEKTAGFGLLGIRERIQLLGGRMKIKSDADEGCRLLIAVPDEGPASAATQAR